MVDIKNFYITDSLGNITGVNFKDYFGEDDLSSIIIEDYLPFYLNHSIEITNLVKKPAELLFGNIYDKVFKTGTDTVTEIRTQGSQYFKQKLLKHYEPQDDFPADFKIVNNGHVVYVKYVQKGQLRTQSAKDLAYIHTDYEEDGTIIKQRISDTGEVLYKIPKNSTITVHANYDVIYIEGGELKKITNRGKNSENVDTFVFERHKDINYISYDFLESFDGKIEAIVPLFNNS